MAKKPWYKRWKVWVGVFVAAIVLGLIAPDPEEEAAEPEVAAEEVVAPTKPEPVALIDEELDAKATESEAGGAERAKADADVELERATLDEAYDRFISESEGVIVGITPEDDYEIINVQLTDDFAYVPAELKQAFVDDFGSRIEANTRATMFSGRGGKDFLYVYFVNSKGEHLVETKHLDKGWKAK